MPDEPNSDRFFERPGPVRMRRPDGTTYIAELPTAEEIAALAREKQRELDAE